MEMLNVTYEAVENARKGNGPSIIEAKTYRWKGHSKSDAKLYRTREEENEWKSKDGIKKFKEVLISEGIFTEEQAKQLQQLAKKEIEDAVTFAQNSPEPSLDSLFEDVYA
jgi:pyruvate dehydrogenase E1 component alpha subunit